MSFLFGLVGEWPKLYWQICWAARGWIDLHFKVQSSGWHQRSSNRHHTPKRRIFGVWAAWLWRCSPVNTLGLNWLRCKPSSRYAHFVFLVGLLLLTSVRSDWLIRKAYHSVWYFRWCPRFPPENIWSWPRGSSRRRPTSPSPVDCCQTEERWQGARTQTTPYYRNHCVISWFLIADTLWEFFIISIFIHNIRTSVFGWSSIVNVNCTVVHEGIEHQYIMTNAAGFWPFLM